MDIIAIKERIIENSENIEILLNKAGFHHVRRTNNNQYRCGKNADSNPTSIVVSCDTLGAKSFSEDIKGDLISILKHKLELSFYDTIKWICKELNIDNVDTKTERIIPFNGYFKDVLKSKNNNFEHKLYDCSILNEYDDTPNARFLKDGISVDTQKKYNIGYDSFTQRITLPWYSINGELIGIMGRMNSDYFDSFVPKYFPLIPFFKDFALYGYSHNYFDIVEKQIVFIFESEKSVLQLDSMGIHLGLALGCNHISEFNVNAIKSLNAKTIIVAFDQDLNEEIIIEQTKKLKMNNVFIQNEVGYIKDYTGKLLPLGDKNSPTDLGKNVFESLVKECVVWI